MDDHKKQIIDELLKSKDTDDVDKKYFSIEKNIDESEWFFNWFENKEFLKNIKFSFNLTEIGIELKNQIDIFNISLEIDLKNKIGYFNIVNNKNNLFEDKILKLEVDEDNQWFEKKIIKIYK